MEYGERPKLSTTPSARAWIRQFAAVDQDAAVKLVDALLLMNAEDVEAAIRAQLAHIVAHRVGPRRKAAVYAEREIAERAVFKSERSAGRDGRLRMRAFGNKGLRAVDPIRGRVRVGSEGRGATLVSQAVDASDGRLLNHPGPDRIRRHKVGLITIVTDFIGSGKRVTDMLDRFMAVPSVRAWRSNRWVAFAVVAAAATEQGLRRVRQHQTRPEIHVAHVAPTVPRYPDQALASRWRKLAMDYGPHAARGASALGFLNGGSLIAFSYRTPNNTPLLLHEGTGEWTPLFPGAITPDMGPAFGLQPDAVRARTAALATGAAIAEDVMAPEARTILVLSSIRGRWRPRQEVELAERTGLSVPEIQDARASAQARGLLTSEGRLTDSGQLLIHAGGKIQRRAPEVPTAELPYYPRSLRAPR